MSAFLGPIHYWLYNKIRLQQDIVDELYELGKENGLTLEEECNSRFGSFENKPLEEMIDPGNIHGWLQERVSQVEYKYAYSVTKLLEKNKESKEKLLTILKSKGINLAILLKELRLNADGIYKAITDNLLDGMPCDHANRIVSKEENEVIWSREICVHQAYWEEVGGDINLYYELRDAFLTGFIRELGHSYERINETTYRISRA